MTTLAAPNKTVSAGAGVDPHLDQPIHRLDDYVTVWLDHARAARAIAALRHTHIAMLRSELSLLRERLDEPRT